MKLMLEAPFKVLWEGHDVFFEVEQLTGEVYRELEARKTLRTEVSGRGYFVKIHRGVGWLEIFKNLLTLKRPVLSAVQEWNAIQRLTQAGVNTMKSVAFAEKGLNPAQRHSFIITEELASTTSLEDLTQDWLKNNPSFVLKYALIKQVACMIRTMHQAGVNHRDCYLCHFLLHQDQQISFKQIKLSVIDLHRAQTRSVVPVRWRNKDLAGIYFSALHIGLTYRDKLRFLRVYFGTEQGNASLRDIFYKEKKLLAYLEEKSKKLLTRYTQKYAPRSSNE